MMPGPNTLSDLLDILIAFRTTENILLMDLCKAYQTIHTSDMVMHPRRFLFRMTPSLPWRTHAFNRATFGDLYASLILEIAKRKVATLGHNIDPLPATQIIDQTFVDDIMLGGTKEDVTRMRGMRTVKGLYTGMVAHILAIGGMQAKFTAVSESEDEFEARSLGETSRAGDGRPA